MTTRETIIPFSVSTDIDLVITEICDAVSGEILTNIRRQAHDEVGQLRIDLIDARPKWDTIALGLEFSLTDQQVAAMVPADAELEEETVGIVTLSCSSTKFRKGIRLSPAGRVFRGRVEVSRDDVNGVVELNPAVVRTTSASPAEGFATFVGALLGSGQSVEIIVDRAARRFDGSSNGSGRCSQSPRTRGGPSAKTTSSIWSREMCRRCI